MMTILDNQDYFLTETPRHDFEFLDRAPGAMADLHFSTELPPRRLLNSWGRLAHSPWEFSI